MSEDMSPYCSAHDEWLIMKLCFGDDMLRPSPNHGTQRLPNDDDDDDACMAGTIMPTMCQILVVTQ